MVCVIMTIWDETEKRHPGYTYSGSIGTVFRLGKQSELLIPYYSANQIWIKGDLRSRLWVGAKAFGSDLT
jgi:hypothetical protein